MLQKCSNVSPHMCCVGAVALLGDSSESYLVPVQISLGCYITSYLYLYWPRLYPPGILWLGTAPAMLPFLKVWGNSGWETGGVSTCACKLALWAELDFPLFVCIASCCKLNIGKFATSHKADLLTADSSWVTLTAESELLPSSERVQYSVYYEVLTSFPPDLTHPCGSRCIMLVPTICFVWSQICVWMDGCRWSVSYTIPETLR